MSDPYTERCECGHGALLHEGDYGCLGAGREPGEPCPCRRYYPIPPEDHE